jgi:toxin ParE1/3/4
VIVRYQRAALADLAELRAFIAADRPRAALDVGRRIRSAIDRLAESPNRGRPGRVPGTRELVVPRLPFIVAYRVDIDQVVVLAILHAARRWPTGFAG